MGPHDETLPTPATAARLADGVAVQRGVRPAGEGFGRHTHDFHSVTVLLSSPGPSLWCYGDGACRPVRPAAGDVFFCPANVPTAVRTEKAFESILLCLSPALFRRGADAAGGVTLDNTAPAVMRKDSFVHRVVTSLADEVGREAKAGRELFASSLATALGVHLCREYAGGSGPLKPAPRLTDDEMARLDWHIARNLDAPLTLEDLASVVGKSRFHFARLFKASTGETPHQYVVRRRVERARELLRVGGVIADVAAAVGPATAGRVTTVPGDIREVALGDGRFDIVLAAAVLHHLRTDQEWEAVFAAFHRALRPGGSVWVFDLVESSIPAISGVMRRRYGEYLAGLKGEAYRDHVFAYVEREDTPRPLVYQLDLLRRVGFAHVEVLHQHVCFAAFGAVKASATT